MTNIKKLCPTLVLGVTKEKTLFLRIGIFKTYYFSKQLLGNLPRFNMGFKISPTFGIWVFLFTHQLFIRIEKPALFFGSPRKGTYAQII